MSVIEQIIPQIGQDSPKRQQVLDGARRAFLEKGFDGTSVNDIARSACVSKGTIYAYFPSKETLFETMIFEDRRKQAEALFDLSYDGQVPLKFLTELGCRLLSLMVDPQTIAYVRMVIAASAKFPEAGRAYFAAGPMFGIEKLSGYFASLGLSPAEQAATDFIELCSAGTVKPLMFGFDVPCDQARLESQAKRAAQLILKAYSAP